VNEAGQVKIPWWKAGTGEWPTEAARLRWERVAVEMADELNYYRAACPGCELVEAYHYWQDYFANVFVALRLSLLKGTPGRLGELAGELAGWDIESSWRGLLPLKSLMEKPREGGVGAWEAVENWVEAWVNFEGLCKLVFGFWKGVVDSENVRQQESGKGGGKDAVSAPEWFDDAMQANLRRFFEENPTAAKVTGKNGRGKAIPPEVKTSVLDFVESEYAGDLRGDGWKVAYDALMEWRGCTPLVRQWVGSPRAMRRIVEAARKSKGRGQKK